MPIVCPNCNAHITCPCQNRIAKDGKATCAACVDGYNKKLDSPQNSSANMDYNNLVMDANQPPVIQSISHKFNNFDT